MSKLRSMHIHSDQEFIDAIRNSHSIRGTLQNLGLQAEGGAYKTFKARVVLLNADTSHFLGKSSNVLMKRNKVSLEEIFIENSKFSNVRKRIKKDNILPYKCSEEDCGLIEWKGKPLTLHLDHINGHNTDHRIENLRWLCPNCHAQTETYCIGDKTQKNKKTEYFCLDCKKDVHYGSKRCVDCNNKWLISTAKLAKITWPSIDELIQLLKNETKTRIAANLGVSITSVNKHLRKHHINPQTLDII